MTKISFMIIEVTKVNHHTVWVKLTDGHIIKRHKTKHADDLAGVKF